MNMQLMILCCIFLPILAGVPILLLPAKEDEVRDHGIALFSLAVIAAVVASVAALLIGFAKGNLPSMTLFQLTDRLSVEFGLDALGAFFLSFIAVVWLLAGIFSL